MRSGEEDGPAAVDGGLRRAVGALEGAHGALGDALQRLLGQHMPARQQHGGVVRVALFARHRAGEHAVEHEMAAQLQLLRRSWAHMCIKPRAVAASSVVVPLDPKEKP